MAAFYDTDDTALDMWDHYIRITDTGVWWKVPRKECRRVRNSVIDGLKDKSGYTLLQEANFQKFVDMTFKKSDATSKKSNTTSNKKSDDLLAIRCFRDGRTRVTARDVGVLFDTLVPHIESVVGKRFKGDRDNAWWAELFVVLLMAVLTLLFTAVYYHVPKEQVEVLNKIFGRYWRGQEGR